ncbi:uncharacterized protein LOC131427199 [Malaya genurostris]|uniref:uncharacterized protein LOC131427199 n=1 Tax=Malaya genurostris TaxID=325434 RepID=UPI0026F3B6E2|nr:uncharacterized protein LOC131427199 [Malaya genurostris]
MYSDGSDYEPDFTNPSSDKSYFDSMLRSSDGKDDRSPPKPRKYTEKDLNPTQRDPRCDADWPLACYWPVFVSNFKCKGNRNDWHLEVSDYFAYKGLLARMVHFRDMSDDVFKQCQRYTFLPDMLVYFTSQQDAMDAIRLCNRENYYGHRLNVVSGREADNFDNERSFRIKLLSNKSVLKTEQLFETKFARYNKVDCVFLHAVKEFVLQFANKNEMVSAACNVVNMIVVPLTGRVSKQRYLESDLKQELLDKIKSNDEFMEMKPRKEVLQALLDRKTVDVDVSWQGHSRPVPGRRYSKQLKETAKYFKRIRQQRKEDIRRGLQEYYVTPESEWFLRILGVDPAIRDQINSKNRQRGKFKFNYKNNFSACSDALNDVFSQTRRLEGLTPIFARNAFEDLSISLFLAFIFSLDIPSSASAGDSSGGLKTLTCNSDEEPDFTDGQSCNQPANGDDSEDDQLERVPLGRCYKPEDLYPTVAASYVPTWPLDLYHPVYVGNFKVLSWDENNWYEQVSTYFAYKGLLTRMVYFHQSESDPFFEFQKTNQLIDMLVYFTSQKDASMAISLCHRDSYYGHKLNVLSGRKPQYFQPPISVRFEHNSYKMHHMSESFVEQALACFGDVRYIMKDSLQGTMVEFGSKRAMLAAVASQSMYKPVQVKPSVMKQRFIEEDVKSEIDEVLKSNPSFMEMKPRRIILQYLYEGIRPLVDTTWMNHDVPKRSKFEAEFRKKKSERTRFLIRRLQKRRKNKRAGNNPEPDEKTSNTDEPKPTPQAQPARNPPENQKSMKQARAETLEAVNSFLQRHGAPPMSRDTVNRLKDQSRAAIRRNRQRPRGKNF